MVCSVQTIASQKRLARLVAAQPTHSPVGLIITDECHHAAARSYRAVYAAFPDALQRGFTATLERGDGRASASSGTTWSTPAPAVDDEAGYLW